MKEGSNKWFGKIRIQDRLDFHNERLGQLSTRRNRWHDKQLDLSTFLINLFITFGLAVLGYLVSNSQRDFLSQPLICSLSLWRIGSIIILLSISFGAVALYFRLLNFRKTKDIVKISILKFKVVEELRYRSDREYTEADLDEKIEKLKKRQPIMVALLGFFSMHSSLLF